MSNCVGYPSEVWSAGGYYFWVRIVLTAVRGTRANIAIDALDTAFHWSCPWSVLV